MEVNEMLTTTFALLRKADACAEGYKKLAKHLGSVTKHGADTPIDLLTVLESNGLADTLWCLRATEQPDAAIGVAQRFAFDAAAHVLPVFEARRPGDQRPRKALLATLDYRAGRITLAELRTAADAADAAAYAADDAYAAADAAYAADDAYAAADAAYAERKWQTERLAQYLRGQTPELLALPKRTQ